MEQAFLHLSDPELILAIDGEVLPRERKRVQSHLAGCPICRARKQELEAAAADFADHQHKVLPEPFSTGVGPRALLKARLSEMGTVSKTPATFDYTAWPGSLPMWVSYAAAAVAVAAILFATLRIYANISATNVRASVVPESNLTPGAVRTVSLQDLCDAQTGSDENARTGGNVRFIAAVQSQVFRQYGMTNAKRDAYEVDYLITPALGGADDVRNLWPEPYSSTAWNAHVKDKLESRLHDMVCAGQVDLATAQSDIATNWIAAYKKYFGTDRPSEY